MTITANPDQLLEQAAAAANAKEYFQAIQLYTDLLAQTNPQAASAHLRESRLIALRERGRLFYLLGEQEAALAGYEQYYLEAGSSHHAVDALVLIGNQCIYMGLSTRALEALREALQLAEALNYTAGRAKALGGIGLVYSYLGRPEEALTHLKKSMSLFEQVDDKVEQARSWNRIGVSHIRLGEVDKAIAAFKASIARARQVGELEPIVLETGISALGNLGECYQNLFDMEQAMIYHQEGLGIAESRELPNLEADLCRNMGVNLRYLDRVEEGIEYLYRALKISRETGQPDIELQSLYSLALAEIQRGNLERGREQAMELRRLAEQGNTRGYLADALHALGLYYQARGDEEAAQQMWQQALFLAHETGRRMLLWQVHAALAAIAPNADLAAVHNRIAAEVIEQIVHPIEDEALRQKFLQGPPVRAVLEKLR
ncbi:MAG: tetratricopeptide repeat protein [Chloroflexi bacterium]|nr:tetratricopeptide repeat protein [Chloroflexota bacterium]MCI0579231.1 tetratricopeptide repeat protein [Chloroflexota bacterium]MCI0650049.1 tetratricopeptide repeat protein [Chloroflexota bacterium]MCI0728834.1 tetratricopeptide repeat protein [Chloroflexota bacterium]